MTAQILFSIARGNSVLDCPKIDEEISTSGITVSPTKSKFELWDPLEKQCSPDSANQEKECKINRWTGTGKDESDEKGTERRELTEAEDPKLEDEDNSLKTASCASPTLHETVGVSGHQQEKGRDERIREKGRWTREHLDPSSPSDDTFQGHTSAELRFVDTAGAVISLTLNEPFTLARVLSNQSQVLARSSSFIMLTVTCSPLFNLAYLSLPSPIPSASSLLTMPSDTQDKHVESLPSATLSVVPPWNFFHMVFEGPNQELLVPITYRSAEEGWARLKVAESQIRDVVSHPDQRQPATIHISHLHEFMLHFFENGTAIRNFIRMGAVLFAHQANRPQMSFTGDLFIRFVPCSCSQTNDPHVPYPNLHAVVNPKAL